MVQRYNPDYVMHAARFAPFARENEHGEFVKFSDYEALVSELASSRQINAQTLQVKLTMAEAIKELTARVNALAVENAALKLSRETLAKNALETCNDVFSAGYHSPALHRGLMESTGNRNTYPNPISALVNEAVRELETPATDAALAAIRTESHIAGVEAAANRIGVISLKYNPGQKHELIKAIGREVIKYAAELREAK
ncbi:hypothetical protein [Serratia ureilytica]|uniref:hypothetical protein n=1 Tax=Serratia ureilytica TaxID=300181 RepID=UPI001AA1918A|nr:hypothetical protein [Serratia ureilytica]